MFGIEPTKAHGKGINIKRQMTMSADDAAAPVWIEGQMGLKCHSARITAPAISKAASRIRPFPTASPTTRSGRGSA